MDMTRDSVDGARKKVLVMFVGGCTYAEVAAVRFLSEHGADNSDYFVLTTKLLTGDSLMQELVDHVQSGWRDLSKFSQTTSVPEQGSSSK